MQLSKTNLQRNIQKHISHIKYIADVMKSWYQQKKAMICYLITVIFFYAKSFTRDSIRWISYFSISSGSRVLKFCKKRPISSGVSTKLLQVSHNNNVINPILTGWQHSPGFITGVNLPPLKKKLIWTTF